MKFNLALSVTVLAIIIAGVVKSKELGLRHEASLRNTLKATGTLRSLVNTMSSSFANGLRSLHAQGMESLLGPNPMNGLRRSKRDTTDAVLEIKPVMENTVVQMDAQMDKMAQDLMTLQENIVSALASYTGDLGQGTQVLIFETVVPNMETQMGKMVDATKDIIEKASPSLTNVISRFSQTSGTETKIVNNILALIKLIYSDTKIQMAEMYMNMRSSVQTAYGQLSDMDSSIHSGINEIVKDMHNGFKDQIGGVAGAMRSTVVDTYNLVSEPIGTSLNTVIDMMGTGMSDMQQYAQKTMDGTSNMIQKVYDDVTNQVDVGVDTVSDRMGDMQQIGQSQMDNLKGALMV